MGIKGHNAKAANLTTPKNNPNPPEKNCNCRNKENYPLKGSSLKNNTIYQATVTHQQIRKPLVLGHAPLLLKHVITITLPR